MITQPVEIAARLRRYLRAEGPVEVQNVKRIPGGHVRTTWRVLLSYPKGRNTDAVLSLDGVDHSGENLSREREHTLLDRLHDEGFPVPPVIASSDDPSWLGRAFLLMEFVPGVTSPRSLLSDPEFRDLGPPFARRLVQLLADLHGSSAVEILPPQPETGPRAELRRWEGALRRLGPPYEAVLDEAVEWLHATRIPQGGREVLVHGDYRLGNFVYDRTGIISVLDWELAHRGDPLEDVAWATISIWRFGTDRALGLVPVEKWCSMYEEASSQGAVDHAALRFWRVLCALKMTIWLHRVYRQTPDSKYRDDQERTREALADEIRASIAAL